MTLKTEKLIGLALLLTSAGCQQPDGDYMVPYRDPHSFARANEVVVSHIDLDLVVNFESQRLKGQATLTLDNLANADTLILDTKDLTVFGVLLDDSSDVPFRFGEEVSFMGRPFLIPIKAGTKSVTVRYETAPHAAALQWLTPEQTAGKRHPFLFTQSQAILARTWIPCQDSPGIRITYNARIKTDPGLLAVMSAENPTKKSPDGTYTFKMTQSIPPYLLALAVGDLEFRPIGKRSGIYAEPQLVARAAAEFEDTEDMIAAAENLYGPYRWERYDILVLPPSFPFGGMENPRLTFATPTVIAGDKSLTALIAHELAHSWSGNLVTNANWDDFWLNEGFTTYFELRIMEDVYGKEYADMLSALSYQDLETKLAKLPAESPDTHLHLNLAGRDPDEGMTAIAYDKGHFFLRTIEHSVGREKWDTFLQSYFDKFAFRPMTSEIFLKYLEHNLLGKNSQLSRNLRLHEWVYGPGIPSNAALVESGEFAKVEVELQKWEAGIKAEALSVNGWTTHHWLHFLRNLPASLSQRQMADLDNAFQLSISSNSEILNLWLQHVVTNKYVPGYSALDHFLTSMGRRKFLKPLYQRLADTPGMAQMGKLIYSKARASYHPISVATIDKILEWQQ